MPKLVAYDGRFELIRMAVVTIAADEGACAVSFARVGEELRLSPATVRRTLQYNEGVLEELGMQLLQRRWNMRYRFGLSGRERAERPARDPELDESARWWDDGRPGRRELPEHRRVAEFRRVLPMDEDDVADARAWVELAGGSGRHRLAIIQDFIDWRSRLFDEAVSTLLAKAEDARTTEEREQLLRSSRGVRLRVLVDGLVAGMVEGRLRLPEVDALVGLELEALNLDGGGSPR